MRLTLPLARMEIIVVGKSVHISKELSGIAKKFMSSAFLSKSRIALGSTLAACDPGTSTPKLPTYSTNPLPCRVTVYSGEKPSGLRVRSKIITTERDSCGSVLPRHPIREFKVSTVDTRPNAQKPPLLRL